ncbi:glycosyltransferase [Paenibacillus sp. EPM92]|uniref:glycosyltransferase n=1 Tax=Paenibacillus sp. EPM92 TaxID=1561195 RepID=UPI0019157D16|nr:glycosyltransferase [Paenibacillus sp. EPM92]
MKILYVSSLCSKKEYKKICEIAKSTISQPAQKYHVLMAEGFSLNQNVEVTALSARPISRRVSNRLFWTQKKERENTLTYLYLPFINFPLVRQLMIFIFSFFCTFIWGIKNKKAVIICDVLNMSVSYGALLAGKFLNRHVAGIVTDVPGFFAEDEGEVSIVNRVSKKINMILIFSLDSYVLLTEAMNEIVNPELKPYCVIEGQVDVNMLNTNNSLKQKYEQKICMYTGSLNRANGIDILIESFLKANLSNSELHIYGSGDYENEIIAITQKESHIYYHGSVHNDIVINEQLKATLLINPRPTNRLFTKYSFPSKNMEYMVSGTPTLTTKLPGMPKEYYKYVYLIEDETIDGISKTMKEIMSKSKDELHQKGLNAKEFVLREKNNAIQAKKIISMIKNVHRLTE